jgi:uncharacterized protein (TIGR02266 family)
MRQAQRQHHGSFIVDLRGTILAFDEGAELLTGWPAIDVVGRSKDFADRRPLFEGAPPSVNGTRTLDLSMNCRDGRRLEVEALADRLIGPGERIQLTVLRVLSRSAERGAHGIHEVDALTGLPNRAAFERQLIGDAAHAVANGRALALIVADVDLLRRINDRLGREAGNEVLRQLAGILRVSCPDEQRIYRIGEDDFAILLTNSGRGEARQIASTLRSTVERHRLFPRGSNTRPTGVTLSLGAASLPTDAETPEDLFERALESLDEARAMGRNRVWCYLRRPRVPLQVPVYFEGAESLLVGYTRDLSPSGVFVQTAAPIDVGMRCALTFQLPGLDDRVHVIGRVVRTVPTETVIEAREVRVPGMGLEFERFGGSCDRRAIDAFVHGHEALSLRPETGRLSY